MASWMARGTMASLTQLSLPAWKLAYNPFSSRFLFSVTVHHCNVYRDNCLHNIPSLIPPGNHARVQNS